MSHPGIRWDPPIEIAKGGGEKLRDDALVNGTVLPKVEGGSDRHILIVQRGTCRLFELFAAVLHRLCAIGSAYENDPNVTL